MAPFCSKSSQTSATDVGSPSQVAVSPASYWCAVQLPKKLGLVLCKMARLHTLRLCACIVLLQTWRKIVLPAMSQVFHSLKIVFGNYKIPHGGVSIVHASTTRKETQPIKQRLKNETLPIKQRGKNDCCGATARMAAY